MIIRVDLFDVKPGRRQDLIDLVKETVPVFERHGAKNPRLMSSFVPDQGIYYGMVEYDDMAAVAQTEKDGAEDDDAPRLLQLWTADTSPIQGITRILLRELQTFGSPPADFSAVISRQLRVKPGRLDDMLAVAEQSGTVMESYGGGVVVSAPVLGANAGEPNLIASGRFPDLQSLCQFIDNARENATMQQVVATMTGTDAPADLIRAVISRQMPL